MYFSIVNDKTKPSKKQIMKTQLTQRRKLEGSFTNYLLGNNATEPKVGEGATLLYYSDRHAAEVLWVSDDKKTCKIREYKVKAKPGAGGMGHQEWDLISDENNPVWTLSYKYGAWRKVVQHIVFDEAWMEKWPNHSILHHETKKAGGWDENGELRLVAGVTRYEKRYNKVNVRFGKAEYHYDWEF